MPIKVLLVDDHTIIRESLAALLAQQSDIEIVGATATGQEAVNLTTQLIPDIVLMDVMLRGSVVTGVQATRFITEQNPEVKVLALSIMEELSYVKRMLSAGASGYLSKGCTREELVQALHAVLAGKTYFSKSAREVVNEDYVSMVRSHSEERPDKLTPREVEMLQRIASGQPSKSIAIDLNISRKTVDVHKRNIMEKLNIWSIAELTQYAMRQGLIPGSD